MIGELDWREPRLRSHWALLAGVAERGWLDPGALPQTLWQGLERFNCGASAFTLGSGPMFRTSRQALGPAATVLVAPTVAEGPLAERPIVDTQGIGIWAGSRQPELAARFLCFLHDEERRRTLWEQVRLFPADHRWDGGEAIDDPDYQRMWHWFTSGSSVPYLPNLLPLELHFEVAAKLGQDILAGRLDSTEASEQAAERTRSWRERDKHAVARYLTWATQTAQAYA